MGIVFFKFRGRNFLGSERSGRGRRRGGGSTVREEEEEADNGSEGDDEQ